MSFAIGRSIVTGFTHVHYLFQHDFCRCQIRNAQRNGAKATYLPLGRNRTFLPAMCRTDASIIGQTQALTLRVLEIKHCATSNLEYITSFDAFLLEVVAPPVEAFNAIYTQSGAGNAMRAAPFSLPWPVEEGDIGAGRGQPISVKQMVGTGVVLIDGLLDEAKAERVGIEAPVAGCVCGDCCQMMQPCELRGKV